MDVMLFSRRLRRLLVGEEAATLPDEMKEQIRNLQMEVEFMTTFMRAYQYNVVHFTSLEPSEEGYQVGKIMEKIMYIVLESEKAVDTFYLDILQNKNESCSSKELRDRLQYLERTIIAIRPEMEQLQPNLSSDSSSHDEYSCSSPVALERKKIREFIIKKKTRMVGREDEMEKLLDLLIEGEPSLSAVSINGAVGVGKSALAAEVYHNIYVKNYFDCRGWLKVPFGSDVLNLILKSVMPLSRLSEIMGQSDQLKKATLADFLRNKKYLIIFVDVCHPDIYMNNLRHFLPDYNNGSRILMISDVGDNLEWNYTLKLEHLNKKQSWEMLTDGDIGKELSDLPDLETFRTIFEDVCYGLPALIVKFRSLLVEKDKQDAILKMKNYFHETTERKDISDYIYENLPDYMKACFIYLVVFHENKVIDARQLYLLWIAEGFVEGNSEATAEKYLEEMVIKGFIQVTRRSSRGRIKQFLYSSGLAANVRILADSTRLINSYAMFELDPSNNTSTRLFTAIEPSDLDPTPPYLHSLLFSTGKIEDRAQMDGKYISENLKFLKLLDMGNLVFDQYPAAIENLILLRYLKLNIPSLKAIPPSLCNLVNLFTLDMPSSYVEEVPDDFWKMRKLRHLNFAFIRLSAHPGESYGSLEYLDFLSALFPGSCTQDLLGRLPNLRTLRIYGDLSLHQLELSKSLAKLQCLETLNLVNESKESSLLPMVLNEYRFPPVLTQLTFSNTKFKDDFMPTLGRLPHLEILKLKDNSYLGRKLTCCSSSFPQLKVLHLKSMLWLDEWNMETGAMPKLQCLVINPCAYLRRLPEVLWCIKTLRKLELWWPRPEMKRKLREIEDMEQYEIQIYPAGL